MLLLLALLQSAAPSPAPFPTPCDVRDPAASEARFAADRSADGRRCLGLALAAQERWPQAAAAFEEAARVAETARGEEAATFWAQAGNAWLAGGEFTKARVALDTALGAGTLTGMARGEAALDRARALVAAGDAKAARADLDLATADAADDPLTWLLSATHARRSGDLGRARADIAQALRRSADDAQVQLEAGNIAASSNDVAGAQAAWREAARLAPDAPAGRSAALALAQFGAEPAGGR